MKEKEVEIGSSYLFHNTTVIHRKQMIGSIVTICGKKRKGKGKHLLNGDISGGHVQFITQDGAKVLASELKQIAWNY